MADVAALDVPPTPLSDISTTSIAQAYGFDAEIPHRPGQSVRRREFLGLRRSEALFKAASRGRCRPARPGRGAPISSLDTTTV